MGASGRIPAEPEPKARAHGRFPRRERAIAAAGSAPEVAPAFGVRAVYRRFRPARLGQEDRPAGCPKAVLKHTHSKRWRDLCPPTDEVRLLTVRQSVGRETHGFQKLLAQERARVGKTQLHGSMIITDFHVESVTRLPAEAEAPLIADAKRMLTGAFAAPTAFDRAISGVDQRPAHSYCRLVMGKQHGNRFPCYACNVRIQGILPDRI